MSFNGQKTEVNSQVQETKEVCTCKCKVCLRAKELLEAWYQAEEVSDDEACWDGSAPITEGESDADNEHTDH